MNDEQKDERWVPDVGENAKAHRSRYAEVKRREQLRGWVGRVQRLYSRLSQMAEEGSPEQEHFERQWDYYLQVGKSLGSLTREEQDRVLEEYPRLVAQLEAEHGL